MSHNFSFLLPHFLTPFLPLRVPQGQVGGDEGGDKGGAWETCGEAKRSDGKTAAAAAFITKGAWETSGEAEGADGEAAAAFITQI